MPKRKHNKSTGRDYTQDAKYNKKTVDDRVKRNKARSEMKQFLTKKYGATRANAMMKNMDVDHKKELSKGGSNNLSNLQLMPRSKNRARMD